MTNIFLTSRIAICLAGLFIVIGLAIFIAKEPSLRTEATDARPHALPRSEDSASLANPPLDNAPSPALANLTASAEFPPVVNAPHSPKPSAVNPQIAEAPHPASTRRASAQTSLGELPESETRYRTIYIPSREAIPASLASQPPASFTEDQKQLASALADEFLKSVEPPHPPAEGSFASQGSADVGSQSLNWRTEQRKNDELYKLYFGAAAYSEQNLKAGRETPLAK